MLKDLQGRAKILQECANSLTVKQRTAVIKFLECGNKNQAMLEAGYKSNDESGECDTTKFFAKPKIQQYMMLVREYLAGGDLAGALEVQKFYTDVMRDKKADLKLRLRAGELLGKCHSLFVDKKEIKSNVPVVFVDDRDQV